MFSGSLQNNEDSPIPQKDFDTIQTTIADKKTYFILSIGKIQHPYYSEALYLVLIGKFFINFNHSFLTNILCNIDHIQIT